LFADNTATGAVEERAFTGAGVSTVVVGVVITESGVGPAVGSSVAAGVGSGATVSVTTGVGSAAGVSVATVVGSAVGGAVTTGEDSGVVSGVGAGVMVGVISGVDDIVGSGVASGVGSGVITGVSSEVCTTSSAAKTGPHRMRPTINTWNNLNTGMEILITYLAGNRTQPKLG
jgi:hypothetical protein